MADLPLAWLPDRLSDLGIPFEVMPGFETWGRPYSFDPWGLIWHHTASSTRSTRATNMHLLRDGVRGIPGPISQLMCHRRPIPKKPMIVLVGAGRANHAGKGWWPPGTNRGNSRGVGLEWVNDGVGEPAHPAAVEASALLMSVIMDWYRWEEDRLWTHQAYAPGRKIDPRAPARHNDQQLEVWTRAECYQLVQYYGLHGADPRKETMQYITPVRVVDTRQWPGAVLPSGWHQFKADLFEVPDHAQGLVVTLTIVNPLADGYAALAHPKEQATPPKHSNINFYRGKNIANTTGVKVDNQGRFGVFLREPTHFIVDVIGFTVQMSNDMLR